MTTTFDIENCGEWDEDVICVVVAKQHRILLQTMHGQVIIDIRKDDVNAFSHESGERKDFLLIAPKKLG